MSVRSTPVMSTGEIREVLQRAVDLYVRPSPNCWHDVWTTLPWQKEMKADGFRAALIWNQFSHTGERAKVASTATRFDMLGSIVLDGTVGGVDPIVTEYVMQMGARYVSMPTLSGSAYQARISNYAPFCAHSRPSASRRNKSKKPCKLQMWSSSSRLRPCGRAT